MKAHYFFYYLFLFTDKSLQIQNVSNLSNPIQTQRKDTHINMVSRAYFTFANDRALVIALGRCHLFHLTSCGIDTASGFLCRRTQARDSAIRLPGRPSLLRYDQIQINLSNDH